MVSFPVYVQLAVEARFVENGGFRRVQGEKQRKRKEEKGDQDSPDDTSNANQPQPLPNLISNLADPRIYIFPETTSRKPNGHSTVSYVLALQSPM